MLASLSLLTKLSDKARASPGVAYSHNTSRLSSRSVFDVFILVKVELICRSFSSFGVDGEGMWESSRDLISLLNQYRDTTELCLMIVIGTL